ncbi:uncharacterized protein LOC130724906 [Lotus japonicus]|uniref:uncharacterized protein LOC130724906 n=1 Tax=Lotus japonicus TaxID=34305 RepID=UPI00258E0F12|nr:uncharacterized protein LOC130724906 [Lotus japonicus]
MAVGPEPAGTRPDPTRFSVQGSKIQSRCVSNSSSKVPFFSGYSFLHPFFSGCSFVLPFFSCCSFLLRLHLTSTKTIDTRVKLAYALARQWVGVYITPEAPNDEWVLEGLAGFLTDFFIKKHLGNNEARYLRYKEKMEEVNTNMEGSSNPTSESACQPILEGSSNPTTEDGNTDIALEPPPKRHRSKVWDEFERIIEKNGEVKAKCMYCNKKLSGNSKNGTNHLHTDKCQIHHVFHHTLGTYLL